MSPARAARRATRPGSRTRRRRAAPGRAPTTDTSSRWRSGMVMIALSAGFDRDAPLGEQARRTGRRCRAAAPVISGCSRRMRSASSAAATDPGVFDAVKMNGSASSGEQLDGVGRGRCSAPPQDPSVLENVMVTRSTSCEDAVVLGRAATAGAEHAEAVGLVVEQERVRVAPAELDQLGQRRGVAAHRVDAVDDDALARLGGQARRGSASRRAMSLWPKRFIVAPESRTPVSSELWASLSRTTKSWRLRRPLMALTLATYPVENTRRGLGARRTRRARPRACGAGRGCR